MLGALQHVFEWIWTLLITGVGLRRLPALQESRPVGGAPSESASTTSAPTATAPASPAKKAEATLVPGNFLSIPFVVEVHLGGVVHVGYPGVAIRDPVSGGVRWGVNLSSYLEDSGLQRLTWDDDPERGIGQRALVNVEDVLGAEGRLGGTLFRFERILDLGKAAVVYALFNIASGSRVAYSFSRCAFQPGYVCPKPSPDEI